MADELAGLRKRLDRIDKKLISALAEREQVVERVAEIKASGSHLFRDVDREEELMQRLVALGESMGLDRYFVGRIIQEILDHSVRVQHARAAHAGPANHGLVVAYQGGEGAYSHLAATRHFGARGEVVYEGYPSFAEMLNAVQSGYADYGVLPIENTTAGSINESYDLLGQMDLSLVGEEVQVVNHCLIGLELRAVSSIRRIYSHPQALAQCSRFLRSLPNCHVEAFPDTALAVVKIKEDRNPAYAAIASDEAARRHGLPILKRNIANQTENYTRMVIVAREPSAYDLRIPCKTSLILATGHEQGALARCLQVLVEHNLNLTKLESRPRPNTPWEYLFYVDFEGNVADARVQRALERLKEPTRLLKLLGSYPARTTKEAQPVAP